MTAEELREKIVARLRAAVKSHEQMAWNLGNPEIGSREWRKKQDLISCAGALALAVEIARLAGTAPQYARSVEHRRQLVAAGVPVKNILGNRTVAATDCESCGTSWAACFDGQTRPDPRRCCLECGHREIKP